MPENRENDGEFPEWLTKKRVLILLFCAALYANVQHVFLYILQGVKPANSSGIWEAIDYLANKPYMTIPSTVFLLAVVFIFVVSRRTP